MKEYKIVTLTPSSKSTVKSMVGYAKSCETTLNKLAKEGWRLVCTESIAQQEMANIIIFLEREVVQEGLDVREEAHEIPEKVSISAEAFVEHPDPVVLPKN